MAENADLKTSGAFVTSPKITVVIPTRERLPVLKYSLQTVLSQTYEGLEILVSDNCGADGTGDFVRGLGDPRLRYVNTRRRVSMSENWEFALSQVESGWVMYIGDDDGLLPGAIDKLAAIIRSTDCEAITFQACTYYWPGASGSDSGRLLVLLGKGQEVRDSRTWLARVMSMESGYTELPIIYVRGIAKFEALDRVRRKGGMFFKSPIPDVYASVALASVVDKYLFLRDAITIAGRSNFSTGGAYGLMNTSPESQAAMRVFSSEGNLPLHPDLPLCADGSYPPSCQALVYDSYLRSSFLRPEETQNDHSRQLTLSLADPVSSAADPLNREWGRIFASLHHLDYERHLRAALPLKRRQAIKSALRLARLALSSVIISDRSMRMTNVMEASLFASAIQWLRPPLLFRLRRALRRVLGRH